jgi:hypothetical protein
VAVKTHREAVKAFLDERHLPARPQAKRLYIVGVQSWKGAASYFEFDDPDATDWKERGLWENCLLRVIPRRGQKNWPYCRRVQSEIVGMLTGGGVSLDR